MYDWRHDIIDVDQSPIFSQDEKFDIAMGCAKSIVEENGMDYYVSDDIDDVIHEEMASIIGLYAIDTDSFLYELLVRWHDGEDNVLHKVRDAYLHDSYNGRRYLCFVTGCGYSIWSNDLLGGKADGIAEREFDAFVRQMIG